MKYCVTLVERSFFHVRITLQLSRLDYQSKLKDTADTHSLYVPHGPRLNKKNICSWVWCVFSWPMYDGLPLFSGGIGFVGIVGFKVLLQAWNGYGVREEREQREASSSDCALTVDHVCRPVLPPCATATVPMSTQDRIGLYFVSPTL